MSPKSVSFQKWPDSCMRTMFPDSNMFMVIPPWVMLKLKIMGVSFSINEGINGKGGMQWTKDLGFDTYVTNTCFITPESSRPCFSVRRKLSGYRFCGQTACHQNTAADRFPCNSGRRWIDLRLQGYQAQRTRKSNPDLWPRNRHITLR